MRCYFDQALLLKIKETKKINIQRKEERKRFKVDFPDKIHIMVLLVCPLVLITALLQRETLRNKTKRKTTPKPTLTTKKIKNTK
jgi:hypothetical protein